MITKYTFQYNILEKKFKIKINIIIEIKRLTDWRKNNTKMVDIEFTEDYIRKEGEYICQYHSDEGIVCESGSTQLERCNIHWKRCQWTLCK